MKKIQRLLCAVLCLGLVCTGAAAETTTSPKNNFYTYATQELAARHPADNEATLTDDELLFEGWTSLKDVENNVRAMILEDLEQISAQPLTAYAPGGAEYTLRQFVEWIDDREQVEAQGAEGMRPVIDMVMSCASTTDFMEMLGQLYVQTGHSPYYYIIYNNQEGASERYIHAYTLYYGLPELLTAEEYRQEAPHHLELLTKLFTLLGYEDEEAAQMAKAAQRAEEALSQPAQTANEDAVTVEALIQQYPALGLERFVERIGLKDAAKIRMEADWIERLNRTVESGDLYGLQCLTIAYAAASNGVWMTQELADLGGLLLNEAAWTTKGGGTKLRFYDEIFGGKMKTEALYEFLHQPDVAHEELAQMFNARHRSQEAEDAIENTVEQVKRFYRQSISRLDWMGAETKASAIQKLDTMEVFIGASSAPVLHDDEDTLLALYTSFKKNQLQVYVNALNDPEYAKKVWKPLLYGDTVNACYEPAANSIYIPQGIQQSPMFTPGEEGANLGALYFVVAHEISHAFDPDGAKFDENGVQTNWWTAEDEAAFEERTQQVVTYYQRWPFYQDMVQDAELTLPENVADLGAAQFMAYRAAGDQDMLRTALESFARIWFQSHSDAYYHNPQSVWMHSLCAARVNGVAASLDEFNQLYGVAEGDPMYVAPEERPRIW